MSTNFQLFHEEKKDAKRKIKEDERLKLRAAFLAEKGRECQRHSETTTRTQWGDISDDSEDDKAWEELKKPISDVSSSGESDAGTESDVEPSVDHHVEPICPKKEEVLPTVAPGKKKKKKVAEKESEDLDELLAEFGVPIEKDEIAKPDVGSKEKNSAARLSEKETSSKNSTTRLSEKENAGVTEKKKEKRKEPVATVLSPVQTVTQETQGDPIDPSDGKKNAIEALKAKMKNKKKKPADEVAELAAQEARQRKTQPTKKEKQATYNR